MSTHDTRGQFQGHQYSQAGQRPRRWVQQPAARPSLSVTHSLSTLLALLAHICATHSLPTLLALLAHTAGTMERALHTTRLSRTAVPIHTPLHPVLGALVHRLNSAMGGSTCAQNWALGAVSRGHASMRLMTRAAPIVRLVTRAAWCLQRGGRLEQQPATGAMQHVQTRAVGGQPGFHCMPPAGAMPTEL